MIDIDEVERDIERLVAIAIEAATTPEEVLEVARAAAAVGSPVLLRAVAVKLQEQLTQALNSASAWEAELTYSKIDAWAQTGHRAQLFAEAWGQIAPGLRASAPGAAAKDPPKR